MEKTTLAVTIFHDEKKGDVIKLLEPHEFEFKGKKYVIPEGYESDGMSIPRFFWRLICPQIDATSLVPSVEHDYLYGQKVETRKEVDQFYQSRLVEYGFPKWKANLTYWGVRMGGKSHWG